MQGFVLNFSNLSSRWGRRGGSLSLSSRSRRGFLCVNLSFLDTPLNSKDGSVKFQERQTVSAPDATLPLVGQALFKEERSEVLDPATEYGEESGRTV
jgi:hypothetical protein